GDGFTSTFKQCVASCNTDTSKGGDCNDFDAQTRPFRHEIANNNFDDNCDGHADESELIYDYQNNQGPTSLFMRFTVNNAAVANWSAAYGLYVRASYFKLSDSGSVMQSGWIKAVMSSTVSGGLEGVINLDGLTPSTVYKVNLSFAGYADGSHPFSTVVND